MSNEDLKKIIKLQEKGDWSEIEKFAQNKINEAKASKSSVSNKKLSNENLFTLSASEISSLKGEFKSDILSDQTMKFKSQLVELFVRAQSDLNIRQIQIGLFKLYGIEIKRVNLSGRMNRLCENDTSFEKVKGKKATYRYLKNE